MKRVALFCLAGWGCFPILAHGPRVKPGGAVTLGFVAAVMTSDSPSSRVGAFPGFDFGVAYGAQPERWNGVGIRVGGQLGWLYGALDVYHQFSPSFTGPTPAGVGVLLMAGTSNGLMPYFTVGELFGSRVYLTQGVASVRSESAAPRSALSVSTIGVELGDGDKFRALTATVLIGHQTRCFTGGMFCNLYAPVAMLTYSGPWPWLGRRRGPRPPGIPRPRPPYPPTWPPVRPPT